MIANGSALVVPGATLYHFGILSSAMHHAWMKYVASRMKSDFHYSSAIIYNNYPWPTNPTDQQARQLGSDLVNVFILLLWQVKRCETQDKALAAQGHGSFPMQFLGNANLQGMALRSLAERFEDDFAFS